jgi:hypothetical protein
MVAMAEMKNMDRARCSCLKGRSGDFVQPAKEKIDATIYPGTEHA